MRVLAPLALVSVLAASACATTAQGAVHYSPTTPAGATVSAVGPSLTPSASAQALSIPATASATTLSQPSTPPRAAPAAAPAATAEPSADPTSAGVLLPAQVTAPTASSSPPPPNPYDLGGPAPVGSFVLGDSISLSSWVGPVLARLGYPVMGLVGQSVTDAYLSTHLSSPLAQAAPGWVIELGTNNAGDPGDVARITHWLDLIDSLRTPGARQDVYWVAPHRPPTYIGTKSSWNLDAFNAELRRLDEKTRWLHVIDFDAVAKGHPEWFTQDTAMHLHPDRAGQDVLVALIAGPDATPAKIPAPVLSSVPPSVEPETFDNATVPPPNPAVSTPPASAFVTESPAVSPASPASAASTGASAVASAPVQSARGLASAAPAG